MLLLAGALVLAPRGGAADFRRSLPPMTAAHGGPPIRAVLTADDEIYLEAQPQPGEGLLAFARRLCGSPSRSVQLEASNRGRSRLLAGHYYRVPLELLAEPYRQALISTLFPADRLRPDGWLHRVEPREGLPQESLWRIARRFTGDGRNFPKLREHNGLADNSVYTHQELLIPADLLLPSLRAVLPAESELPVPPPQIALGAAPPAPPMPVSSLPAPAELPLAEPATAVPAAAGPGAEPAVMRAEHVYHLEYGQDHRGEYAIYRLKPGEALYSSVVVRFTGRIYAADVNALATEIAAFNGIPDVTDMPIGFPVKIPFGLLQAEFLPPGHPLRNEYETSQRASAQFSNTVRSNDLAGITIILDAGHGGRDAGATKMGVWESVYVYDIVLRLRRYLQTRTSAEVFTTTQDGDDYRLVERDVLPFSQGGHRVLTSPPYDLGSGDARVGVNLRWYLANSLFRDAVARGRNPEQVLFLSIHADSLHPSLRGAMVYIPDAYLRQGSFEKQGVVYSSRREVREQPRVSYSWKHRVQSQGLSRQLAEHIVGAFQAAALPVHVDQPVRQKIYRGRQPWVPAVLRYNAVPALVLLEVGNLANDHDRALLQTQAFRQQAAEAIASGILAYYGRQRASSPETVARSVR